MRLGLYSFFGDQNLAMASVIQVRPGPIGGKVLIPGDNYMNIDKALRKIFLSQVFQRKLLSIPSNFLYRRKRSLKRQSHCLPNLRTCRRWQHLCGSILYCRKDSSLFPRMFSRESSQFSQRPLHDNSTVAAGRALRAIYGAILSLGM